MDHVIAAAGCLASASAAGAVMVLLADAIESRIGPATEAPGAIGVLWVVGSGLMAAPMRGIPVLPVGISLFLAARRLGFGGWAVATGIGALMAVLRSGGHAASAGDGAIGMAIGAAVGSAYWLIVDFRTRTPPPFIDG